MIPTDDTLFLNAGHEIPDKPGIVNRLFALLYPLQNTVKHGSIQRWTVSLLVGRRDMRFHICLP